MSNELAAAGGEGPGSVVRVHRVGSGETLQVWTWSAAYQGTLTHYGRLGTEICQGQDCPAGTHRTAIYWKGYAAVGIWHPARCLWEPGILEITENLELDFRGKWQRGQVWELSRARQQTKKKTPVGALLLSEGLGLEPPPAFDLVDTLCRFYHTTCLNLGAANPLPPRTMIATVAAPAPPTRLNMERARMAKQDREGDGPKLSIKEMLKKKLDDQNKQA